MKDLLQAIRKAFADVRRPTQTMADAEVMDDWGDETNRFCEHDAGWWEIPDTLLETYSNVFCYLKPDALLYYLPAYISWYVRCGYKSESNSAEHLICFMADTTRFTPVWNSMSAFQMKAVLRFAESCPPLAEDEAERNRFLGIVKTLKSMSNNDDTPNPRAPSAQGFGGR